MDGLYPLSSTIQPPIHTYPPSSPSSCMTSAAATMPAVSDRSNRGPSDSVVQPAATAAAASSSLSPPSGPISSETADGRSFRLRR